MYSPNTTRWTCRSLEAVHYTPYIFANVCFKCNHFLLGPTTEANRVESVSMRLLGRDITHQVRQLQQTSQCNHRNIARNIKNLPRSRFGQNHLSRRWGLQLRRRGGAYLLARHTPPQTRMVAKVSRINSLPGWIFDVALCSVPISASREGSLHLEISFHFAAPAKSAENVALFCCLTCTRVKAVEGYKCSEKETKHRHRIHSVKI